MTAPGGSGVSAVMPAAASAARIQHERVRAIHDRGTVGHRRVEFLSRRESPFAQARRVDARGPHPCRRRGSSRHVAEPCLDFGDGRQRAKRRDGLDGCGAERVDMTVDEARDDGAAARVDHPRGWPCESADVRVGSDGDDAAVAHRDGLGDREPRIDGDDLPVDDEQIGGPSVRRARLRLRLRSAVHATVIARQADGDRTCAAARVDAERGSPQPVVEVRGHEGVVGQVRVGAVHAIDLVGLPRAQHLVCVEAARGLEQALPAQHLVDAGDAAGKAVGGVEERGVGVGDLDCRSSAASQAPPTRATRPGTRPAAPRPRMSRPPSGRAGRRRSAARGRRGRETR